MLVSAVGRSPTVWPRSATSMLLTLTTRSQHEFSPLTRRNTLIRRHTRRIGKHCCRRRINTPPRASNRVNYTTTESSQARQPAGLTDRIPGASNVGGQEAGRRGGGPRFRGAASRMQTPIRATPGTPPRLLASFIRTLFHAPGRQPAAAYWRDPDVSYYGNSVHFSMQLRRAYRHSRVPVTITSIRPRGPPETKKCAASANPETT